jgi:xylose isomerase
MELLMLIVGIVLIWKFSTTIDSLATSAKAKTQVVAEKVITDAVEDRTENFESHLKRMKNKKVYSHSDIIQYSKME